MTTRSEGNCKNAACVYPRLTMESNVVDRNLGLSNRRSEHLTTNVNENDFSICSKISYARPCRHGCYRQAIRLRSNAPARGARYHGGFVAAPRENPI